MTIFFAPEREAPGKAYRWEISSQQRDSGIALCLDDRGAPAVSVYGNHWTAAYEGEIVIYERTAPLPRAYVVYGARHVGDESQAVAELLSPEFPRWRLALTAEPVALPAAAPAPLTPATIVSSEDTRVVIRATALTDGLLVLGDSYYPGWEATVDGERAPIVRSNHIFRGVLLPPGEHEVVFVFRPCSLFLGLGIAFVGGLLAAGLVVVDRRTARRHSQLKAPGC